MKNFKFTTLLIILKLLYLTIAVPLSPENCPVSCTCDLTDDKLRISSCDEAQSTFKLPSIFTADPGLVNVTWISAVKCLIQSFPENICLYPNLTYINFEINLISSLSSSNFDCISGLTDVNLKSNKISDINGVFSKLKNLSKLDLANNNISQLTQDSFNGLSSLESLDLSYNHLKSISANTFNTLINLQEIDLSYNNFSQIDDGYFTGLIKIKSIYLSNNQISRLSKNSFNNLRSLNYLFLERNKLNQNLDSLFIGLTNLIQLDLSFNDFRTIELWPTYLSSLSVLLLRFNKIEKFTNERGWFIQNSTNLPPLKDFIVDLQFNSITELSDITLEQYGVKTFEEFSIFMSKFFNVFNIDHNPIDCSCNSSVNLIANSLSLIAKNSSFFQNSQLFSSKCRFPAAYENKSIIAFDTCISVANSNFFSNPLLIFSYLIVFIYQF